MIATIIQQREDGLPILTVFWAIQPHSIHIDFSRVSRIRLPIFIVIV
jgi:hypothetical protein